MTLPKLRVTIREVARAAGVGVGTVSRVIGGSTSVSPQTRERVTREIKRLKFQPSRAAQALVKGKTETIGVLVPYFTKHYFLEILRGIESASSLADHSLIVYNVERPEQALKHLEFLARTRRVDALIVISLSPSLIRDAYPRAYPFPIAGIDTELPRAIHVRVDHGQAIQLAVNHLAALGHRRIALVDRHQDPATLTVEPDRREGYLAACAAAGLSQPSNYYVLSEYGQEEGYEAARKLLTLRKPPTALACASDLQAFGATRAVEELGLRIGSDVAVTGYHDIELATWVGLTTVHLPAVEMGSTAVRLVLEMVDAKRRPPTITLEPHLIVRRTSGVPPQP